MNPASNNFLKSLRENWFLVTFVTSIIIGWTTIENRVANVQTVQAEQKNDIVSIKAEQQELRSAVIESKASFIFIKESISDLKNRK